MQLRMPDREARAQISIFAPQKDAWAMLEPKIMGGVLCLPFVVG